MVETELKRNLLYELLLSINNDDQFIQNNMNNVMQMNRVFYVIITH